MLCKTVTCEIRVRFNRFAVACWSKMIFTSHPYLFSNEQQRRLAVIIESFWPRQYYSYLSWSLAIMVWKRKEKQKNEQIAQNYTETIKDTIHSFIAKHNSSNMSTPQNVLDAIGKLGAEDQSKFVPFSFENDFYQRHEPSPMIR